MSIYIDQIKQLVALQHVDGEIHVMRKELEEAPKALQSLREELENLTAKKAHQEDKMFHLREQEKRLGIEIEEELAKMDKSKSKMMLAENAKEYTAVMREMDSLERLNRDREEEKTALVEELALQLRLQAELNSEFEELTQKVEETEASLKERLSKAEAEIAELGGKRKDCAKDVPAPVFSRYEFIRERLSQPVIVPVSAGVCSGCHIAIPPQSFIELQKGAQILSCPNCQRLMYWEDHFTPKQEDD